LFDLDLAWDRSAHTGSYAGEHVLRVRIRPRAGAGPKGGLPVRMAIALDTSSSMDGEKLARAKQACSSIVGRLRQEDKFWLAAFGTRLIPCLENVAGGGPAASGAQTALGGLKAVGVTRTDYAIEWVERVLQPEPGTVRAGVLITDGHATDPRGNALSDLKPLTDAAARLGARAIALFAVGLGSADDFNTGFLADLGRVSGGAFLYADAPEKLEQELRRRLSSCQGMAAEDATLLVQPVLDDVRIVGLCRIRPDYVSMDVAPSIRIGSLRADAPTDILVSVLVPPKRLEQPLGSIEVLEVRLNYVGGDLSLTTAPIEYTTAFSRAQQVNSEVDQDRLVWAINTYADALNRTTDRNKTGELLSNLAAAAQMAGQGALAGNALKQLDELKSSGKLSAHSRTQVLAQSRDLGGNP